MRSFQRVAVPVAVVATLSLSAVAGAQTITQADALTRLLSATDIQATWFAPEFLAQVPLATIAAQLKSIPAAYGAFVRLDTFQGMPLAVYTRGTLVVTVAMLDAQGRLTGFGAVPGPVSTAPDAPTDAQRAEAAEFLRTLFDADPVDTARFSAGFLSNVSAANLTAQFTAFRTQYGAVQTVTPTDAGWRITFEKGRLDVTSFTVDAQGLITSLRVQPVVDTPAFASLDEARVAFAALPGQVSVLVQEVGGPVRAELNSTRPLAIGSAFKLAILGELQAQVAAGSLAWTGTATLTDADKSLPSGTLQNEATGSTYTLRDLAARMIAQSDNTATNVLLRTVGRAGVEARLGQSAMPDTREFFALKNPANIGLLRAYRAAGLDRDARRAVLAQAASAPLPNVAVFAPGRITAQDVEWFASTRRLCALMADVAALPETQLSPGVAKKADFARVSFKGGSETGVLNLTTQVTTQDGRSYCVSATWNRPQALDDAQFAALYGAVLTLLK